MAVVVGKNQNVWDCLAQVPDYTGGEENNDTYGAPQYMTLAGATIDDSAADGSAAPLYEEIAGAVESKLKDEYALPEGWEVGSCKGSGRIVYIDHGTKTTHWLRPSSAAVPSDGDFTPLPTGWEFRPSPKPHFVDHNTRTSHNCDPRPVPQGWEQKVTPIGVAYFANHQKKITQWHHPCSQSPNPPPKSEAAKNIEVDKDPTGKLFYKDHRNKCTAWDNPLLRPNYFRQFDKAQVYSPGWELVIDPATGKHLYFNHCSNVLYGL